MDTDDVSGVFSGGSSCGSGTSGGVGGYGSFLVFDEVDIVVVGEIRFYHSICKVG